MKKDIKRKLISGLVVGILDGMLTAGFMGIIAIEFGRSRQIMLMGFIAGFVVGMLITIFILPIMEKIKEKMQKKRMF